MFKKILSIIFVTLIFISVVLPVSAADASSTPHFDTSTVEDDLKLIYPNLLNKFPRDFSDKGIYLIHFSEYGFDEKTQMDNEHFGLYLYVYNPSGKDIYGDVANVQFGCDWGLDDKNNIVAKEFKKYELELISANGLNTLIKYKVKAPDHSIHCYDSVKNTRRYEISGIEIYDNQFDAQDYTVGFAYTFSGFSKGFSSASQKWSTLSCVRSDILTLRVKAHQVSYLTGDSAAGAGYSNQVNSVYFSIPKEIEDKFGSLYHIKYEYNHFYTNPIIITDNWESYNVLANDRGKIVDHGNWPYSLFNFDVFVQGDLANGNVLWTEYRYNFNFGAHKTDNLFNYHYYYNDLSLLTSVFYYPDGFVDGEGEILVTSDEFQDYFRTYSLLHSADERVCGYSANMFDLDKSKKYQVQIKDVDDKFSLKDYNSTHKWWPTILDYGIGELLEPSHNNSIVDANFIEKVTSDLFFGASYEVIEKKLLMDSRYFFDFEKFYSSAYASGDNVYLLRYAYSDNYRCLELNADGLEGDFIMAQANVYLDFDFIEFAFKRDNQITVIPVVSNPTDGFPNIENTVPDKEGFGEYLERKKDEASNALWAIVAVLALAVVVIVVIKKLPNIKNNLDKKKIAGQTQQNKDQKKKHRKRPRERTKYIRKRKFYVKDNRRNRYRGRGRR